MELAAEKRKKLTFWIVGVVAACILIFLGVQNIGVVSKAVKWCIQLVSPLILGFALAFILNVPTRFFERHLWKNAHKPFLKKIRRPVAFLLSVITIIGVAVGVIWLVVPELAEAVKIIAQVTIDFINKIKATPKAELAEMPLGNMLLEIDWDNLIDKLQNWLKNQSGAIANTAVGTVSSIVGGVVDFFIAFVFAIYILFSKEKLKSQASRLVKAWLPERFSGWLLHASSVASINFRNFISGQSLEAVILGVLCMVGMLILRIPYAPTVGALVGVTALIPVVGGFIGAIVGAIMILTVSPMKAVIFVIYLLILQQLEGDLIYPKVMGSRVNLPAIWILAAVTIGGEIAGPLGMLLSVPIASTAYVLIKEATLNRESRLSDKMK